MTQKYIYHHLGLGDHIICNGMIRHFCKVYDNVVLFCYSHNCNNVEYMYRDLNNLEVFKFDTESEINQFIFNNKLEASVLRVGFEKLSQYLNEMTFDRAFYKIVELDFSIRFDKFYFKRNSKQEEIVYSTLNPTDEKYIFVHDDPSRGYEIKIDSQYKIIKNDLRFGVFDYIKILENAEEVHYMQSSFADLINSYKLDKPKLFLHTKVRNYNSSIHSVGLNQIVEI